MKQTQERVHPPTNEKREAEGETGKEHPKLPSCPASWATYYAAKAHQKSEDLAIRSEVVAWDALKPKQLRTIPPNTHNIPR